MGMKTGRKFNSSEEVIKERELLSKKYEDGLPDYLHDYFDEQEMKHLRDEVIKKKYSFPIEERREFVERRNEEFWEENDTELVKSPRTVRDDFLPVYEEPLRAEERVAQEEDLSQEEVNALIQACGDNMYAFAVRYFPHYLKQPSSSLHKYLYKTLAREISKKKKVGCKYAIAAPRANAKSSIVSNILPLWCVCYNKKRFIVILSNTVSQAEDFLADIKRELELNTKLAKDFPHIVGKGPIWRAGEIITSNSVKILALGTGSRVRGRRFGVYRPDLVICHKKGTKILYNNKWINVEDHPTAIEKYSDGIKFNVWGLPFSETVTKDHKYYVKRLHKINNVLTEYYTGFEEADNLTLKDYIGYEIDYSVVEPQPVDFYEPIIENRDEFGRITRSSSNFIKKIPNEFFDKDMWWLIGLWWGGGYSSGKHLLNISFANKDINLFNRFSNILGRYGKKFSINKREGYFQAIFCWSWLARWLKSWRIGNSKKKPPMWVEKLPIQYQKELIRGYIDADGWIDYSNNEVRLTSIYLEGLLSVRRILSRIGIPSTIRKGSEPRKGYIDGRLINSQQKYDLRFRKNANLLGIDIKKSCRYNYVRTFIEDGYLWSKIRSTKEIEEEIFVPIKTENSTYTTYFGLSHNCDDLEDSEMVRSQASRDFIRNQWFNKDVMFAGGEEGSPTDFFIIGTVLGKDALLNALLDSSKYPEWRSRRFKAVLEFSTSPLWDDWAELYRNRFDLERQETARKFFEDHREEMLEDTKVLWPDGDPYYNLMIDKLKDLSGFLTEKMNESVDLSKVYVTREILHWENFYTNLEVKDAIERAFNNKLIFGAIDPSLGKKSRKGDYSAIVTLARDPKSGYIFVLDINLKRRSVDDQIHAILAFHEKFKYKLFAVETNAFQYVVAESLRKKSRELGIYVPVEEINNYQDKKMRFESIVPFLKDGTIVFDSEKNRTNQMYNLGIEQICTFTGEQDSDDDSPDCLEMAFRIAQKPKFKLLTNQNR